MMTVVTDELRQEWVDKVASMGPISALRHHHAPAELYHDKKFLLQLLADPRNDLNTLRNPGYAVQFFSGAVRDDEDVALAVAAISVEGIEQLGRTQLSNPKVMSLAITHFPQTKSLFHVKKEVLEAFNKVQVGAEKEYEGITKDVQKLAK